MNDERVSKEKKYERGAKKRSAALVCNTKISSPVLKDLQLESRNWRARCGETESEKKSRNENEKRGDSEKLFCFLRFFLLAFVVVVFFSARPFGVIEKREKRRN